MAPSCRPWPVLDAIARSCRGGVHGEQVVGEHYHVRALMPRGRLQRIGRPCRNAYSGSRTHATILHPASRIQSSFATRNATATRSTPRGSEGSGATARQDVLPWGARSPRSSHFPKPEMPKGAPFVPRTLPPPPPEKPKSRAQRERDAKAYWDGLTEAQEVWALRKMGYFAIGRLPRASR